MNILVVENEETVADLIARILKNIEGVNLVQTAYSFNEGFSKLTSDAYDLVLIDIHLGEDAFDGIELCRTVRKRNADIPVIMVSSLHGISSLEEAFDAGANDYITKPFRYRELEIRARRWLKLSHNISVQEQLEYGDFVYKKEDNAFLYQGKEIRLTKKEKRLLSLFLERPEQLLGSQYLQEKLWGDHEDDRPRNVRSNIQKLRKLLDRSTHGAYIIENIHGEGYRFSHKQ